MVVVGWPGGGGGEGLGCKYSSCVLKKGHFKCLRGERGGVGGFGRMRRRRMLNMLVA